MMPSGWSTHSKLSLLWGSIIAFLLIILGLWCGLSLETLALRHHLARWTVLSLHASVVTALTGLFLSRRLFLSLFLPVSRSHWRVLGGTLALGFILVFFVAPRTNRIYFDEHVYQNIAQTIAWTGEAFMCNEGEAEYGEYRPFATEYNKQPNGHPYYLSFFFQILGVREWVAHFAVNCAYLLAIFSVFALVLVLFRDTTSALFACGFYALTPMVVIWSNSTAAEPTASALAALALFAAAAVRRSAEWGTLLFLAGTTALALQVRPESILLPIPIVLLLLTGQNRPRLSDPAIHWAAVALILFSLPGFLHLFAVRNESWGSGGDRFGLDIFWQNLSVNGPFLFKNLRYPLIFTVFALFGLVLNRQWSSKLAICVWGVISWGVFLFFYAGSYNYGADVRFSLISAAPIAVLAGLGTSWASARITQWTTLPPRGVVLLLGLLVLIGWSGFLPLIRAEGQEAVDARFDVSYGRELAKLLPPDSIVLAHNPGMWLLWGKNSAQMSTATLNRAHVDNDFFNRYAGGVYLHWNFWCNVPDPDQNRFCQNILSSYESDLIQEFHARRFRYGLYRLYEKDPAIMKKSSSHQIGER